MLEKDPKKNIKISNRHHTMLKEYCEKNGMKVYKAIEKMIDNLCTPQKRKDIYGDDNGYDQSYR